ncbi:MAG: hypothetical protein ACLFR0_04655 [Alphaproteobacteria bacterium]
MKIELDLTVSNSTLSEASRKLGKQIAEAAGEEFNHDKHIARGFEELKARMQAEANKAALEALIKI